MKKLILHSILALMPLFAIAQSDPHVTMFMYNKLLYNPGYAGSRDMTSVNALYRNQWAGIPGAPKTISITADGPAGSYMLPFRHVATGISVTNEKVGIENNTAIKGYYAYRIKLAKSVLSLGLSGGGSFYSAAYSNLTPFQQYDQNLTTDVRNAFLPNFGTGAYWCTEKYYLGLSVPSLLENKYDKKGTQIARQVRGYYLSAGYVYELNSVIKLKPQVLARIARNSDYGLPFNCDINLSAIAYDRLMIGATYRTDKSLSAIAHIQVTQFINMGYSYDYLLSDIAPYARGAHEFVVGLDLVRDRLKYTTPRFSKSF
ncbi:MAG: type IX secretion system membrane protein PorP/SprF [Flavipsychrobacter sp.]|nr:type IX secretion system membrane protein PorP/SprF [Flavipsychrobacter sp.]